MGARILKDALKVLFKGASVRPVALGKRLDQVESASGICIPLLRFSRRRRTGLFVLGKLCKKGASLPLDSLGVESVAVAEFRQNELKLCAVLRVPLDHFVEL